MFRLHALGGVGVVALQVALAAPVTVANAQDDAQGLPPVTVEAPKSQAKRVARKPAVRTALPRRQAERAAPTPERHLPVVIVDGGANASLGTPPIKQRFALPQESYSITAKQIDETINLKDPEDAVKYMPSLFVRKRNDGDNQAVLATRTWGLSSSARTLIYYDDLLVSALIGNNNSGASPHWNLISPEAISRIDFLNGPFSAAYPGNSIGGVLLVTSKMPDHAFATAKETVSVMPWNQYGTKDTYVTSQTSAAAGNRNGPLSWLVTANYLDSYQQPLTYTTSATIPAGTTGTFPALNKLGLKRHANVVGTGALAHSQQTSGNFRLAYDVTPLVQATYSLGIWNNRPDLESADLSDLNRDGAADLRRHLQLRQQQIHLGSDPSQQRDLAQERHQGRLRFRSVGIELQLPAGHHAQSVHRRADGRRLLPERQDHP